MRNTLTNRDMDFSITQKIFARWYLRIIAFLLVSLTMLIGLSFLSFPGNNEYLYLFSSIFISSAIIEAMRPGGFWYSFGFGIDRFTVRNSLTGLISGLICVFIAGIFAVSFGGDFSFYSLPDTYDFINFSFVILLAAATEEIIFRGIVFQALIERFNPIVIIILSSLVFSAGHALNNNFSDMAMINIFLANITLSFMYIRTGTLWLPIAFHFSWNYFQYLLLGSPVSGISFSVNLFYMDIQKMSELSKFIYGEYFGIEEGLLTTIFMIVIIPVINKISQLSPYAESNRFKKNYYESNVMG